MNLFRRILTFSLVCIHFVCRKFQLTVDVQQLKFHKVNNLRGIKRREETLKPQKLYSFSMFAEINLCFRFSFSARRIDLKIVFPKTHFTINQSTFFFFLRESEFISLSINRRTNSRKLQKNNFVFRNELLFSPLTFILSSIILSHPNFSFQINWKRKIIEKFIMVVAVETLCVFSVLLCALFVFLFAFNNFRKYFAFCQNGIFAGKTFFGCSNFHSRCIATACKNCCKILGNDEQKRGLVVNLSICKSKRASQNGFKRIENSLFLHSTKLQTAFWRRQCDDCYNCYNVYSILESANECFGASLWFKLPVVWVLVLLIRGIRARMLINNGVAMKHSQRCKKFLVRHLRVISTTITDRKLYKLVVTPGAGESLWTKTCFSPTNHNEFDWFSFEWKLKSHYWWWQESNFKTNSFNVNRKR